MASDSRTVGRTGVYGAPPSDLVDVPSDAIQVSPLMPGAALFDEIAPASLASLAMLAPPGTLERRRALALALRALAPGGRLVALAPKDKGGARIARELAAMGVTVEESAKRHHRICEAVRPEVVVGIEAALAGGGPRLVEPLGLWSEPGIFSWDRVDAGTDILAAALPPLSGRGADLGCGIGILALAVLAASPEVTSIALVDTDRRAIDAARRNVADPRASFIWADVRALPVPPQPLDFVICNPPFHDGGAEDRALGAAFVEAAARFLAPGGTLWLVANRHLPYEAVLSTRFAAVREARAEAGFKVIEARR